MAKKKKRVKASVKKPKSISKKKKVAKKKAPAGAKKISSRKKVKKASVKTSAPSPTAGLETIGEITHFFPHVNAGVIKLAKPLAVGENIYIKGHTTDFKQKIESMQIDRVAVQTAKAGDEIGVLVKDRVRGGDKVYRV